VLETAVVTPVEKKSETADVSPTVKFSDSNYFKEGETVDYWRKYEGSSSENIVTALTQELASTREEFGRLEDVPYFAYHLFRSSFFTVQGFVGLVMATANGGTTPSASMKTPSAAVTTAGRLFLEALITYRQDYRNIQEGLYSAPFDMEPAHRQFNPLYSMQQSLRFFEEATATLTRKAVKAPTDVWMNDSNLYPDYYRHTFHYQTDGWFSEKSAKVYDTSTETLFVGRQDAMQRHTMVPFGRFMKDREQKSTKVLEIAAGTGRFHTFLRDSYPELETCCSDLSPFYLAEATRSMDYWRRYRGDDVADKGSTSFVQANAENLPFEDESFDAVLNVYLFHELPMGARRNVMKEVARVLKPGGIFVLTDSLQLGDTPWKDPVIGNFGDFAEPHYRGYITTDFGKMATELGLVPSEKEMASATKVLSFYKPEAPVVFASPTVTISTDDQL